MILSQRSKKVKIFFKKFFLFYKNVEDKKNAPGFTRVHQSVQLVTATSAAVIGVIITVVKATAKKKDYNEDDNPRITTVIATHKANPLSLF